MRKKDGNDDIEFRLADLAVMVKRRGPIRAVAKAIGEPESTLRAWVNGNRRPNGDRLSAVIKRVAALSKPKASRGKNRKLTFC